MARVLVHVEGQTEETFVAEILRPHLVRKGFESVSARLIGNSRLRDRRGGICGWHTVRSGIVNHLRQDSGCIATTMVDYYGLPQTGEKAWPGRADSIGEAAKKAERVEEAIKADLCREMGESFNPLRFLPFVTMHEFEALLFSDCQRFAEGIGREDLKDQLETIRRQFTSPEEINDSPETAPSKRISKLVSGYEKPLLGPLAVLEIGLEKIRSQCPHFDAWLTHLERLGCGDIRP